MAIGAERERWQGKVRQLSSPDLYNEGQNKEKLSWRERYAELGVQRPAFCLPACKLKKRNVFPSREALGLPRVFSRFPESSGHVIKG